MYLGGRVYAATESSGGSGSWLRIGDRLISYKFINIHSIINRRIFQQSHARAKSTAVSKWKKRADIL